MALLLASRALSMLPPTMPPDPPGCVSDVEWRNYQNDTCATYSAKKWCGGGKLNVPAMGGPIMGSPEWACCACNDRRVPPDTAGVTEIIFYATHNIEIIDRQVLVRYTQELTPVRSDARVWTLLYDQHEKWRDLAMTSAWLTDLFFPDSPTPTVFPTLKSSIRDSAMYHQTGGGTTSYLAYYFWFHMSLFYWLRTYRNQYPNLKYLWRIEPDVLFSGDISQMLARSWHTEVDVLLPFAMSKATAEKDGYPQFHKNDALLDSLHVSQACASYDIITLHE